MTADEKIVEAVARAIDPDCFEDWQRSFDYEIEQSGDREEARRFAEWSSGGKIKRAKELARAAITAYQAEAWQPIETAKRGDTVLGFQATPGDWGNRMAVCWDYGPPDAPVWIGEGGLMPTHWRPLPPAPKASP